MYGIDTGNDKTTAREFIEVAHELYRNDPDWIRPLDKDIDEVFNEEKNKAYRFGETVRWIIKDDEENYSDELLRSSIKNIRTKVMMCLLAHRFF